MHDPVSFLHQAVQLGVDFVKDCTLPLCELIGIADTLKFYDFVSHRFVHELIEYFFH